MPIYEYECKFCSHRFEFLQKISEPIPEVCPHCGKKGGVRKLISEASFMLKGSGWYVTDYKNNNKPKGKGTSKNKNVDTEKAGKSKTDTNKTKEDNKR